MVVGARDGDVVGGEVEGVDAFAFGGVVGDSAFAFLFAAAGEGVGRRCEGAVGSRGWR